MKLFPINYNYYKLGSILKVNEIVILNVNETLF